MIAFPLMIAAAAVLAGCASTDKQILVKPELMDKPRFEVPAPMPVQQNNFEWVVITKQNAEMKFKEIEGRSGSVTLFALTPSGYQNLSMNVAELRRYIQQQNAVIAALKKYYEAPSAPAEPAGK